MNKPVVFFGDLVTDMIMQVERLPIVPDQVQNIRSITLEPGGAGNSLIVAARLGAKVIALGTIGEDANGDQVHAMLQAEGVDVSHVQRGAGSINMTVLVLVDDAGEHVFLVHEGRGAPLALDADTRALIEGAALFFMPGYALHEPRVGVVALDALEIAVRARVPVICDLGPIAGQVDMREPAMVVIAHSAACLLTEAEALLFTGQPDADAAATWLQAVGARDVVIKRGPDGCLCYPHGGGRLVVPGLPVADVRDTSGAGDAFAAGYVLAWLAHGDMRRAAAFANVVGAAKVRKLGTGRQMPTRAEIAALPGGAELL